MVRPTGDGKTSSMKEITRSTAIGFEAAPTRTGATFASANPAFSARRISSSESSPVSRYFSSNSSLASATASVSFSR